MRTLTTRPFERLKELRTEAFPLFGGALLGALLATARFSVTRTEAYRSLHATGRAIIYVLWHGRLLPITYSRRGEGVAALISRNRDGEYIARIVKRWGYEPVRGSSSRGGSAALRQLVRRIRQGQSIAITPDGPRGPRQHMKPGALLLGRLSGAPIVPVSASADRAWWFGRWDRFLVPQPFSRIRVAYGEPLAVPRSASDEELAAYQDELQMRLDALTRSVDAF